MYILGRGIGWPMSRLCVNDINLKVMKDYHAVTAVAAGHDQDWGG